MKKAIVILAEGFEEIEAITPIDILRRANIDVKVCSLADLEVKGSHGISVKADIGFDEIKGDVDAVILPGGSPGARNLSESSEVSGLIQRMASDGRLVAAICASPAVVLFPAGILKGKKATCYPGTEKVFGKDVEFIEEDVVVDGNVITSRGAGTAVAFSLEIVAALAGKDKAESLRKEIVAK